jgi:hypothetical protein
MRNLLRNVRVEQVVKEGQVSWKEKTGIKVSPESESSSVILKIFSFEFKKSFEILSTLELFQEFLS